VIGPASVVGALDHTTAETVRRLTVSLAVEACDAVLAIQIVRAERDGV
jgi:hypothetical protein